MKNFKKSVFIVTMGSLLLVGCVSSTPMKKLTPSEMIVGKKSKYTDMKTSEGLTGWEKGLWEYKHNNYEEAKKLLEPHRNKNISMIQHAYGYMYHAGLAGFSRNYVEAEKFYLKAIKIDNYPNSLNNLASLYMQKDSSKALELYTDAAKQGYSVAQFNLGNGYHFARQGFSQDYGKAYYWYQQASNQGHAKAARRLGYMYDRGEGFERDIEKALYWHKLAVSRGNNHSQSDVIRLKSELYKKIKNRK